MNVSTAGVGLRLSKTRETPDGAELSMSGVLVSSRIRTVEVRIRGVGEPTVSVV